MEPDTTEVDTRSGSLTRRSMADCILNGVREPSKSPVSRFSAHEDPSSDHYDHRTNAEQLERQTLLKMDELLL